MTHAGFLGMATAYFVQKLGPLAMECAIKAVTCYLQSLTRSDWDEGMATFANAFNIQCDACKAVASWDAAPEELPVETKNNDVITF